VAGDANSAGLLPLFAALAIAIDHGVYSPGVSVFDSNGSRFDAQVEIAGGFGAGNFRVERAPLRADFAALHAKALLNAKTAPVEWTVVHPTVLQCHTGRLGKSRATPQVPLCVRASSQVS